MDLELKIEVKAVRIIVSQIFYRLSVWRLECISVWALGVLQSHALWPAQSHLPPTHLRKIRPSNVFLFPHSYLAVTQLTVTSFLQYLKSNSSFLKLIRVTFLKLIIYVHCVLFLMWHSCSTHYDIILPWQLNQPTLSTVFKFSTCFYFSATVLPMSVL